VSAYVTHAVFPKESWKKFADGEFKFKNFWVTDSIPHAVDICTHDPFKLLSLCEPIAKMLMGFDLRQQH
jgi:phosphoribosylpyrophosphate synthetase